MAEEKFLKLKIDQDDFAKVPKQEQIMFLAAQNILNEIYTLQKCAHFTVNPDGNEEVLLKQLAISSQAFFFVRLLASVVYEAEQIVRIGFYGAGEIGGVPLRENLVEKYDSFWNERTKQNFKFVDDYFRGETIFGIIRNRFGFHYRFRDDTEALNRIHPDEWNLYLNESHGISLHQIALAVNRSNLMSKVKNYEQTDEQAFNEILNTILTVSSRFTNIFGEYLAAFCNEYLSNSKSEKLLLANLKRFNEVNLPFFVSDY